MADHTLADVTTQHLATAWSTALIDVLLPELVGGQFYNDKNVPGNGFKTIRAFQRGKGTVAPLGGVGGDEVPSASAPTNKWIEIDVDQSLAYNTEVGLWDELCSNLGLTAMAATSTGEAMRESYDTALLTYAVANAGTKLGTGSGNAIVVTTPAEAEALFRLADVTLSKLNVPRNGRKAAVDAETRALIASSETFIPTSADNVVEGLCGRFFGFNIFESNLLPQGANATAGQTTLLFGTDQGATKKVVADISEFYTPEKKVGIKNAKGAVIYAREVVDPTYLCSAIVKHTA